MTASRSDMMPLWTDAYVADTLDLSAIQHGMYFMLLIRAWRSGEARLADNERALANISRVSLAQWRKHSPAVMAYWKLNDGFWTQKRLTSLWETHSGFRKIQSERAKNSPANRQKNEKRIVEKPSKNNGGTPANAEAEAEEDITQTNAGAMKVSKAFVDAVRNRWEAVAVKHGYPSAMMMNAGRVKLIEKRLDECAGDESLVLRAIDNMPNNTHWTGKSCDTSHITFEWVFGEPPPDKKDRFREALESKKQTPKAQHDRSNTNTPRHEQKTNSIIQSAIRSSSRVGGNRGHEIPEEWASPPTSRAESS